MQRNTLGDFLLSNHAVMNKIMKFDLAARQQAAMQMPYIPHDESINTLDDIHRSIQGGRRSIEAQRDGQDDGMRDWGMANPGISTDSAEERDQLPTPRANNSNNNMDQRTPPRIPPPASSQLLTTNPFHSTANHHRATPSSSPIMAPPRANIAASYSLVQRQPSSNTSRISADNTTMGGTMHNSSNTRGPSPARMTPVDSHSNVNQHNNNSNNTVNLQHSHRQVASPSPNPSILLSATNNTMSTVHSRMASPRTTIGASYSSHVRHQSSTPPSVISASSTMHSGIRPPILFASHSSNNNIEMDAGYNNFNENNVSGVGVGGVMNTQTTTNPPVTMYYGADQALRESSNGVTLPPLPVASRVSPHVNAGGKSTMNPATLSYYQMMQREVESEPIQEKPQQDRYQHQHLYSQPPPPPPAAASATTTSYYYSMEHEDATYHSFDPPQNPGAFPAAMCYSNNFGGTAAQRPPPIPVSIPTTASNQSRFTTTDTPDWGAFRPAFTTTTSNNTPLPPQRSLADDALNGDTGKRTKERVGVPSTSTGRAVKRTASPTNTTSNNSSSGHAKNHPTSDPDASKCNTTPGSSMFFDFVRTNILNKKPSNIVCGPPIINATMSGEEESREKKSTASSLWAILDPTEDLDYTDDDETNSSSPTRTALTRREARANKAKENSKVKENSKMKKATETSARKSRSRTRSDSRDKESSESPSNRGGPSSALAANQTNGSTTDTPKENEYLFRKAYNDLMFLNSSHAKREDTNSGDDQQNNRGGSDSRKSPRTINKDSPLKGLRSIHYTDERETTRSTPRKTSQSKNRDDDHEEEDDRGRRHSSRQRRRDSSSDERRTSTAAGPMGHSKPSTPKQSHRRDRDGGRGRGRGDDVYTSDGSANEGFEAVPFRSSRSRSADHKSRSKKAVLPDDDMEYSPRRSSLGGPSNNRPSSARNAKPGERAKSALREGRYNNGTNNAANIARDDWKGGENAISKRTRQLPEELPKSLGKRVLVTGAKNRQSKGSNIYLQHQTGPSIDINFGADSRVSALSVDETLSVETRLLRRQLKKVMCRSGGKKEVALLQQAGQKSLELSRGIPARLPGAPMHMERSFDSATSDTSPSFAYPLRKQHEKDALEEAFEQCLGQDFLEHARRSAGHRGGDGIAPSIAHVARPRARSERRGSNASSASSVGTQSYCEEPPVLEQNHHFEDSEVGGHEIDGHYMYVAFSRFGEDPRKVIQLCEHASMPVPNPRAGEILVKVLVRFVKS
jgi:hypothetical protein